MPASLISAYAAFYQPGVTKIYVVTTIANILAPSRAELNAGTDVTRQCSAIDGWQVGAEQIERPDYSTLFTSKIGGRTSAEDSSLTFYLTKTGADVRTLQPRGYLGFVVFLDGGDVTGSKMDVFPVLVSSAPKQRGDSAPFQLQVQYSITAEPAEDVTIPA